MLKMVASCRNHHATKHLLLAVAACVMAIGLMAVSPALSMADEAAQQESSAAVGDTPGAASSAAGEQVKTVAAFSIKDVPTYNGEPTAVINGDVPYFTAEELKRSPYMAFSFLEDLGRCGPASALIDEHMMPEEERGSIGQVRPTGWRNARYGWIDGEYVYNRCHLLAYQLTGQNANALNLITGTRSMNTVGMEDLEIMVAEYIWKTGNHVLYRATPVFEGDNLVASGVLLEARSIEDDGKGVCFCRWCYNVEPGVEIDYATGENHADGTKTAPPDWKDVKIDADVPEDDAPTAAETAAVAAVGAAVAEQDSAGEEAADPEVHTYILNTNTLRFHWPDCKAVRDMKEKNKQEYTGTREDVIAMGYTSCGICRP